MCEPTTLLAVSLAVGAAGAAAQYRQTQLSGAKQEQAINDNQTQANKALSLQQEQINKQSTDQISERARAAMIERGRIRAASGESGLGDNSGRIEAESLFNQSTDIASIESNRDASIQQNKLEMTGVAARSQGDRNRITRPSLISTGLQVAGAGLDAYDKYDTKTRGKVK